MGYIALPIAAGKRKVWDLQSQLRDVQRRENLETTEVKQLLRKLYTYLTVFNMTACSKFGTP